MYKVGQCFDVGRPVFTQCKSHHESQMNGWTGNAGAPCIVVDDNYLIDKLEQDTQEFARLVSQQLKAGTAKPCDNGESTDRGRVWVKKTYGVTDMAVAIGAIKVF